jgi:hypothetical protein
MGTFPNLLLLINVNAFKTSHQSLLLTVVHCTLYISTGSSANSQNTEKVKLPTVLWSISDCVRRFCNNRRCYVWRAEQNDIKPVTQKSNYYCLDCHLTVET